ETPVTVVGGVAARHIPPAAAQLKLIDAPALQQLRKLDGDVVWRAVSEQHHLERLRGRPSQRLYTPGQRPREQVEIRMEQECNPPHRLERPPAGRADRITNSHVAPSRCTWWNQPCRISIM